MTDMLVKLYEIPDVAPLLRKLRGEGIAVHRARAHEKHPVVEWVRGTFGTGWAGECDVSFGNLPISCCIATQAAELIGFACYDASHRGFFGPLGV